MRKKTSRQLLALEAVAMQRCLGDALAQAAQAASSQEVGQSM